jgi:hypothetical protein
MKLVCPACGATASLEAWLNDPTIRYFQERLIQLPSAVLPHAPAYLGLFRKHGKALPWKRALTLIKGLKDLVAMDTVQWEREETRPITAVIWGQAMEATIDAGPQGLKNHNYLRHVAWEKAAELAAKREQERENERQRRRREGPDEQPAPLSADIKAGIKRITG